MADDEPTRHWILLRHGESVANADNWLAGQVDTPLTERGRAQADQAGRDLAGFAIGRVVSSDLSRARETAERAIRTWAQARGQAPLAVEEFAALRERGCGSWAHRDRAELRAQGQLQRLTTWEGRPPGGESQGDLWARVLPCLADIESQPVQGATLVVAHGGVLRVLLGLLDGTPRDDIGFFGVPNAQPIHRRLSAEELRCLLRDQGLT